MASLEQFSPLLRGQPTSETTDTAAEVVEGVSESLSWAISILYLAGLFIAGLTIARIVLEIVRRK